MQNTKQTFFNWLASLPTDLRVFEPAEFSFKSLDVDDELLRSASHLQGVLELKINGENHCSGEKILKFMSAFPNLNALHLTSCSLNNEDVSHLLKFERCAQLSDVSFDYMGASLRNLIPFFAQCTNLHRISIIHGFMLDDDFYDLFNVFGNCFARMTNLRVLNLSQLHDLSFRSLKQLVGNCTTLRRLGIAGIYIPEGGEKSSWSFMRNLTNLEHLNLSRINYNGSVLGLLEILKNCRNLTSVTITSCPIISRFKADFKDVISNLFTSLNYAIFGAENVKSVESGKVMNNPLIGTRVLYFRHDSTSACLLHQGIIATSFYEDEVQAYAPGVAELNRRLSYFLMTNHSATPGYMIDRLKFIRGNLKIFSDFDPNFIALIIQTASLIICTVDKFVKTPANPL